MVSIGHLIYKHYLLVGFAKSGSVDIVMPVLLLIKDNLEERLHLFVYFEHLIMKSALKVDDTDSTLSAKQTTCCDWEELNP